MFLNLILIIYSVATNVEGYVMDNKGGRPVNISEVPYQLSLHANGHYKCGAVLIASDIALTAAHCVVEPPLLLPIGKFEVFAGSNHVRSNIHSKIEKIMVDPKFNIMTGEYDVALLELKTKLKLNRNVNVINLPSLNFEVPDGSNVTASGWNVNRANPNPFLMITAMLTRKSEDCNKACSPFIKYRVTDNMICTEVADKRNGPSPVDSGGPLVYKNVLIGIKSWSCSSSKLKYPAVFTKVSHYFKFISDAGYHPSSAGK